MLKLTYIARLSDGLPLAAQMTHDSEVPNVEKYKQQRKQLLKQLQFNAPKNLTVESGPYNFHIVCDKGVCFMTLCERSYSSQLAFSFLYEVKKEFLQLYGNDIDKTERPFAFNKFDDKFIQDTIRLYSDTRTKRNLDKLKDINNELGELQQIMKKNIKDILDRGEKLTDMTDMSDEIRQGAKKLKIGAINLNRWYYWRTYGPAIVVILIVIVFYMLFRRWFS